MASASFPVPYRKNQPPHEKSVCEGVSAFAVVIDEHFCKVDLPAQGTEDLTVDGVRRDQIDIMAVLGLRHAVDAGFCLVKIRHGVIEAVKAHGACRRQRDAEACRRNLSDENMAFRVVLKTADFPGTVLYAAADTGIADSFFPEQGFDVVQFRDETCHDNNFPALVTNAIDNVRKRLQFRRADLVNIRLVISEMPARDLGEPEQLGQHIGRSNLGASQFREAKNGEKTEAVQDLSESNKNAEYLAMLDRSQAQLLHGDVVVKSMEELEHIQ